MNETPATTSDPRYQWDLTPLLPSADEAVVAADRAAVKAAAEAFAAKWQARDDYLTDAAVLRAALDDYEAWTRDYGVDGRSGAYFWMRESQDQTDPIIQAQLQRSIDVANVAENMIQFFELKLGQITPADQVRFLAAPELANYRHFLERQFVAGQYQLSEAEERILNLKANTSYTKWVQLTNKVISQQQREVLVAGGQRELMSFEQLLSLTSDSDKLTRDEAAAAVNDIFMTTRELAEAEINAILANKKVDDELRGFERPDSARHLGDDIDTAVVDALLEAVAGRNDIAHRFYRLKADLLGVSKLAYHERNVEVGQATAKTYDWATGSALVDAVYTELEPEFGRYFKQFKDSRQIDVYPRAGKHGGAFCIYFSKALPTYLLLNYTDKLRDVTTLAHELGHALNNEYMRTQNALNYGTPMATAEVASQYLEDFVMDRLLTDADEATRLAINLSRLNDGVSSIFRQVACYRFEQALHQSFRATGYLSADDIAQLFTEHMAAYMGPAVEQSAGSSNWWVYWSHIRSFFYVYSYASGLLIAKAIQRETRRDRAFLGHVKTFLAAGRSASPRDTFAAMNIDITGQTFWQAGLDELETLQAETEALARQLGHIK